MTFYEAGLLILEKAGHPLSYQEIAARAVQEGILSHVGQMPEQTMRERLVALAKRQADRKVVVVGQGQFALTDWGLVEDEAALAELENMKEGEPEGPPIRGRERHPAVTKPAAGRDAAGRKKKRRLPPLSAVAQDLLKEAGQPLPVEDLLARARQRGLVSEDLGREMFVGALQEENRRRAKSGKRPIFEVGAGDAIAYLAPPEPAEGGVASAADVSAPLPRKHPVQIPPQALESRRSAARTIRRIVNELGPAALEQVVTQLLEKSGYRDLRAHTSRATSEGGNRGRLLTARRKLGLTEVRFAVRIVSVGEGEVQREDVQRLRAELATVSAHAGLIIGPTDATREARNESQILGQSLVTLLCADALAEEIVMRHLGVITYETTAVEDSYWRDLRRLPRGAEGGGAGRNRLRAVSSAASPPATGSPPPEDRGEGERENGPVTVPEDEGGETGDPFEMETATPEIEQFLNESIPPKPPDALPLQGATPSEEGREKAEPPAEPHA
jgi:ribonuclease E